MFSFFKRKPPEKWVLVKTVTETVDITIRDIVTGTGKIYYHLHESDVGNRKVVFAGPAGISGDRLDSAMMAHTTYQEKIYRWLNGRVDPDIPTYSQIPEEETAVILRGTI